MNVGPMKIIDGKIFHVVRQAIYLDGNFTGWEALAYFRTIPEAKAYIMGRVS